MAEEKKEKVVNVSTNFDCLAVTQVLVYPFRDGANGLFVSYPLDPFFKGEEYKTICSPISRQLREHIENCVLEKYQAAVA